MIELIILKHLKGKLDPIPVYLEQHGELEKYVVFEKLGSSESNKLYSSMFAFQSYANTLYETVKLNELVKQAVESLIEVDEIGFVKLNSDYNFTDTETKKYRYQAVCDINHY